MTPVDEKRFTMVDAPGHHAKISANEYEFYGDLQLYVIINISIYFYIIQYQIISNYIYFYVYFDIFRDLFLWCREPSSEESQREVKRSYAKEAKMARVVSPNQAHRAGHSVTSCRHDIHFHSLHINHTYNYKRTYNNI